MARTKGSRRQCKHPSKSGLVTVPGKLGDDLASGTLNSLFETEQPFETSRFEVMKYLVVLEPTETGYFAYSPDLPGCVSTGATQSEVEHNMREASSSRYPQGVAFHLEGLKLEGLAVPQPTSSSAYIEIAA